MNGQIHGANGSIGKAASTSVTCMAKPGRRRRAISAYVSSDLKPDGTCTLAHKCNQFVSDKGPGGYCMGPHARCTGCDYDAGKKLRAPAA